REAMHELAQGLRTALEERLRQPAGWHDAEGVAVAAGILGGDQPARAADADRERPPLRDEDRREGLVVLARPQVAAQAQEIVQLVRVPRRAHELGLHLLDRVAVEQVAQLLLAEQ